MGCHLTSGITLPEPACPRAPQPSAPDSDQHPPQLKARNHAPSGHRETTANLGTYPKAQALKELAASLTAHPRRSRADLKIRFVDVTDFVMGTAPELRGFCARRAAFAVGPRPKRKASWQRACWRCCNALPRARPAYRCN